MRKWNIFPDNDYSGDHIQPDPLPDWKSDSGVIKVIEYSAYESAVIERNTTVNKYVNEITDLLNIIDKLNEVIRRHERRLGIGNE